MSNDELTEHFSNATATFPELQEALAVIRKNSFGAVWLIGGFVYRSIASMLYGVDRPGVDLDFIIEKPIKNPSSPEGWKAAVNRYGNPKFVKEDGLSIDFVPLENISSIVRRQLPATIENFLTGTPLNIQSIAYDVSNHKVIGEIGTEALKSKTVAVNDFDQAAIYAEKKQKSINDIIQEKAEALGFEPILTA